MENPNFGGQALEQDRIVVSRLLPGPAIVRFGTMETMIIFPQAVDHRVFFVNADFVSGNSRVVDSRIFGYDSITIGRQNQDVPLHHNFSSRKHAEVRFVNGKYTIVDVGSKFGTFVTDIPPCLPEDSNIPAGEWRSVPLSTDVLLFNHDRSHGLKANFRRKNGKLFISPVLVRRDIYPFEDYNGEREVPEGVVFKLGFDDSFQGVTNLPNPTTGNSDAHELMAFASFMRVGETLLMRNDANMNDHLLDKTLSVVVGAP